LAPLFDDRTGDLKQEDFVRSGFIAIMAGSFCLSGCASREEARYASSADVQKLSEELQTQVQDILEERCGTPESPLLLSDAHTEPTLLKHGAAVYARHCQSCHGLSGDGNGPAAPYLSPRPRDYRPGVFKFTSTPYGQKPTRADLIRFVRRGAVGTAMPGFPLLGDRDVQAVVEYVIVLSQRGELERYLAQEADAEGEVSAESVDRFAAVVTQRWKAADTIVVHPPREKMPRYSADSVAQGKQLFLKEACSKCHGEDGRGRTQENVGKDVWGNLTRAADLTTGMFHGGSEPEDIYRRIYLGINGTPMPSFSHVYQGKEENIWLLVHYVKYLGDGSRREVAGQQARRKGLLRSHQPSADDSTQAE
jgi:mono/diheme cytochrome c family protein